MRQVLYLTVKTNAPETKITQQEGDQWRMDVRAPPENNKANLEIIKFLAKYCGADVKILKGRASRKKTVLLTGKTELLLGRFSEMNAKEI